MMVESTPSSPDARYGTVALLRRLLREQASRYWKSYLLSFVLMAVMAASISITAYLIKSVVNATYASHDFGLVVLLCTVTIGLFSVRGLAQYGQGILLAYAHADMTARNQKLVFGRLLAESMEHLSASHSAEIANRINFSTAMPAKAMDLVIAAVGREGLSVLGLAIVMIYQDPLMSLICLVSVPLAFLLARSSRTRLQDVTLVSVKAQSHMAEMIQEALHGMRIIKAFNLERVMGNRADARIGSVSEAEREVARLTRRSGPWVEMLSGCVIALILLYGSYRIIALGATPGEFVSFLTAFMLAYDPAKRLVRFPVDMASAMAGVRMLYEMLDSKPSEPPDDDKPDLVVSTGSIALNGVTFGYRCGEPVLHQLSLLAPPGKVTALVGHSGGGKSTILGLLLRLYECQEGAISIDGQNIAEVSRRSLRRNIAYLGQDVFLFHGTIGENIAVGRLGASQDDIVAAAQAAFAHDFVTGFPLGYDTPVGEHGLKLSSGQRQRITIARAFLKNAPIILLDEPTASLDTISEREVHRAIARLCAGRTTLVVAHRLHTIVDASTIYVIGNGQVVESGDHRSLLQSGTAYHDLHRLQLTEIAE